MIATLEHTTLQPLSLDEMYMIDGGAWSWADLGKAAGSGAITGGVGGAAAGAFGGGVGALPGGAIGAGAGAVGGALAYAAFGWW